MKLLLVTTSLDDPERLKRFEKILKRYKKGKVLEIMPKTWIVKSEDRANIQSNRLTALLETTDEDDHDNAAAPINERLFVCTIMNDNEHRNGWLDKPTWDWIKNA